MMDTVITSRGKQMSKSKDKYDILIDKIEEATEKAQHYQGILNGYYDGEIDESLEQDEAERLAESWSSDVDKLSDESNLMLDTLWDLSILTYASKRKTLKQADDNRHKGKMSIQIA